MRQALPLRWLLPEKSHLVDIPFESELGKLMWLRAQDMAVGENYVAVAQMPDNEV